MEINNITFYGSKIQVIFTGEFYYFYSPFYGLVAYSKRDYEKEIDNKSFFSVYIGNNRCSDYFILGLKERVKKYIKKEENKYISKDVTFEMIEKDLNKSFLEISIKDR